MTRLGTHSSYRNPEAETLNLKPGSLTPKPFERGPEIPQPKTPKPYNQNPETLQSQTHKPYNPKL